MAVFVRELLHADRPQIAGVYGHTAFAPYKVVDLISGFAGQDESFQIAAFPEFLDRGGPAVLCRNYVLRRHAAASRGVFLQILASLLIELPRRLFQ